MKKHYKWISSLLTLFAGLLFSFIIVISAKAALYAIIMTICVTFSMRLLYKYDPKFLNFNQSNQQPPVSK